MAIASTIADQNGGCTLVLAGTPIAVRDQYLTRMRGVPAMRIPTTLHVARISRVFPASRRWHPLLMEALSGIPDVRAGGFIWWHCDMIRSVAPAENQHGWGGRAAATVPG